VCEKITSATMINRKAWQNSQSALINTAEKQPAQPVPSGRSSEPELTTTSEEAQAAVAEYPWQTVGRQKHQPRTARQLPRLRGSKDAGDVVRAVPRESILAAFVS